MTADLGNVPAQWLPSWAQADPSTPPLFCLPHAGGGASAFRSMLPHAPGVAVLPVQPPGREDRFREPPYREMTPLVSDLADVVLAEPAVRAGRPYAVYGHSLGALIAFELLREIRRRGAPAPVCLIVSGCAAPQLTADEGLQVSAMSRPEVVAMLRALGGTPEWVLSDEKVLDMILPPFQADFAVKESYRYTAEPPLDVPLTVLASTGDARVPEAVQAHWRQQTAAGFTLRVLDGGHFAVLERPAETARLLSAAVTPWL